MILPGLMCDGRMFADTVAAFDAQVIDGFYDGADGIGAMADFVLARLPDRCALLGHSMGGRIALELWRRAPERIDRIAIANSGIHPVRPGEAEARHALLDLGRREGVAALVDRWLPPMVGPEAEPGTAVYASLHAMAVDAGLDIFAAQIRALLGRPDAAAVLPTLTCPVAIIGAEHDGWSPPAQQRAIAAAIPNAQLAMIPTAGHMASAENPPIFNRVLADWLARPSDLPSRG
ncbi:alpha/beta fold hydrolase [Sphingomonas metalli]|uniref:alpha/beta fold hydrolase n=1 Tax=Sphingomonas metalli TaxID=1779358 RepID=UPI001E4EA7FA|nr:alpha/beta hydrolase [Sphingomonas metalli]